MPLQTIVKTGRKLSETPNLDDYIKVCADFSWTKARNELNGLPDLPNITACFFGGGAVAEGEFHKSMNLTALWKLPVLFVCENNLYAMGTALARHQAQTDIALKAAGYGVPAPQWIVWTSKRLKPQHALPSNDFVPEMDHTCSSVTLIVFAHTRCTTLSSTGAKSPGNQWRTD